MMSRSIGAMCLTLAVGCSATRTATETSGGDASPTAPSAAPASSSSDDWTYDGPRSACSTGPAYEPTTTFPALANGAAMDLPPCIARCGVEQEVQQPYGSVWSIAALPSGACEHGGEACGMSAVRTLSCSNGQTVACSFTGYACRCEAGNWRCYSGPIGASACVCTPTEVDSGAPDAKSDGG